ncbi:diguanylate cyclase [Chitinimonas sp.]|uniref:GGDEF domain-containing protein n=1 Tax=Chitinimonas sp. TaxID=1934313 RepID=UPI002F94AB9F
MPLRIKLILALLLTSLLAVALVGGVAYLRVTGKFDELRRQQAENHFRGAVASYLAQYGSWQAGVAQERFDHYMERQRGQRPPPGPDNMPPPPPPEFNMGPLGGPPEGGGPRHEPPFRFILTDDQYRVMLGAGLYEHGQALPPEARQHARPVVVDGRVAAYVSAEGTFGPSRQEREYLATMREALLFAGTIASLLAVLLGLWFAGRLAGALQKLTHAVEAMRQGELRQSVPVNGKDEVAALGRAFNTMSEQLAESHAALQASHRTISEQAEQLREMSIRDALTGLYNRRHFDEQARQLFEQCQRYERPLAIVIADIDHFKRINDQLSHATGDAVLRQVGALLQSHVRQSDLVARYGGEEFVLALPETTLPQAAALCEKLRDLLQHFPWSQLHPELKVTMSLGLCADLSKGSLEAMLQTADARLYEAKAQGRNRLCFAGESA